MAFILDEQKQVNDSVFTFEKALNSGLTKFTGKSAMYVTYYHVDADASTADNGFIDIEHLIGKNSPIKFKKIENFPLYGMESIQIALNDEQQGIDGSYEGEFLTLPNTIKPLPNDLFIINHIDKKYIFKVTSVSYDTLRENNYYKAQFKLDLIDDGVKKDLDNQVSGKYNAVMKNLGSENQFVLESEIYTDVRRLEDLISDLTDTYMAMYYSEKYNCFICDTGNPCIHQNVAKIYDPLMSVFIDKHHIFSEPSDYRTIILGTQYDDNKRPLKYGKSVWGFIEKPEISKISHFSYYLTSGHLCEGSIFERYHDLSVQVADIKISSCDIHPEYDIFTDAFLTAVRNNFDCPTAYSTLVKKWIRGDIKTLTEIDNSLHDELINLGMCDETFFLTPMIIYIIREIINRETKVENDK